MKFGIGHGLITTAGLLAIRVAIAAPVPTTSVSIAAPPSVTSKSVFSSLHDGRLVRDAAALHLEEILPNQNWVLAKVKPDERSFRSRTVGIHFDQAHKLVEEPGVRVHDINIEEGSLEPLLVLSGTATAPNAYHWEYEPETGRLTNPSREEEERFPIFRSGSEKTALFRINETLEGRDQFQPAYLLGNEWQSFVRPALTYVQTHREVFDPYSVIDHREQLQQLLLDPNPLLAITAARILGGAYQLDTSFVQGPLGKVGGLEQSVFAYLLIKQLPHSKHLDLGTGAVTNEKMAEAVKKATAGEIPVEDIGNFIDNAKDAETLKNVAVGLIALLDSDQKGILTQARVQSLLARVLARQKAMGKRTAADDYLDTSPTLQQVRNNKK